MTPEAQRIAIAEACGWKVSSSIKGPYDGCPCGTLPPLRSITPLPDYLNDLNAMHEAEKTLTDANRGQYGRFLTRLVTGIFTMHHAHADTARIAHATAAQRAEAFLRTVGKWEDIRQ